MRKEPQTLQLSHYPNVQIFTGNAIEGLPATCYDAIIVSASITKEMAARFAKHLALEGRLVAPVLSDNPKEADEGIGKLAVYKAAPAGIQVCISKLQTVNFVLLK